MNQHAPGAKSEAKSALIKADPTKPALIVTVAGEIAIRAGTVFGGQSFTEDTPVVPQSPLEIGDYLVGWGESGLGLVRGVGLPLVESVLGGFHFAPGGNASARRGGDETPAINPCSLWDLNFRPACASPFGMSLVEHASGKFWCDIYLLGVDHLDGGTSRFGVTIADGDDPFQKPDGKSYKKLDYETALAVMRHHGKGLLSIDEFFAAAFGVTEKTAHSGNPRTTGLDAPRTSKFGVMQATGNMWVWGHDGDPDEPRASIFGGSWISAGLAGSRYAVVGYWPGSSSGHLGARGRSDHLQLG